MKKFLICLLVVAIALLGFTGCPSPTTEDSGVSGPEDSVDESLPELSELRALTKTALGLGTGYTTLTPARVNTIFGIVDEIEGADYGLRAQDFDPNDLSNANNGYPGIAARAADGYQNYDYYDEQNKVNGFVHKATKYPVYEALYTENIQNWARILPDGDLAPGDTLDKTYIYHRSNEWPEVILKSGGQAVGGSNNVKDDIALLFPGTGVLDQLPYYLGPNNPDQRDVVVDGKWVVYGDYTYTNEYTKISERNIGNISHVDTYFTRDYDYSLIYGRAYSIDTGVNFGFDTSGTPAVPLYPNAPGAFKIKYELIVKSVGRVDLMITDNRYPLYPVKDPGPITSSEFKNSIGGIVDGNEVEFTIKMEIRGKKQTNTAPYIEAEDGLLLEISISSWQDLIDEVKKGTFARISGNSGTGTVGGMSYTLDSPNIYSNNKVGTGNSAAAVDDRVIDWVLGPIGYMSGEGILPGAAVDKNGDNVVYSSFASLPEAVRAEILKATTPVMTP